MPSKLPSRAPSFASSRSQSPAEPGMPLHARTQRGHASHFPIHEAAKVRNYNPLSHWGAPRAATTERAEGNSIGQSPGDARAVFGATNSNRGAAVLNWKPCMRRTRQTDSVSSVDLGRAWG